MAFYKCKTCGRIREFTKITRDTGTVLPLKSTCIGCGSQHSPTNFVWEKYSGFVSPTLLTEEDRQAEIAEGEIEKRKQAINNATRSLETEQGKLKRKKAMTKEEIASVMQSIDLCRDVIADMTRQIETYATTLDNLGNREAVNRHAKVAHDTSNTQKELFLGNRQYVSGFATSPQTKKKILDVPSWSWGLNCAWVEGGIKAKAHYEVKIEEGNAYTEIPENVKATLDNKSMEADDFLALCEQHGAGSLLWYNKDGANRPTWTALEMATLLRAGYRFKFDGVVQLLPPN